ncbi:MAG: hypothetical protein DMG76_16525 [Acidobacteria bacterium]|nr:MAG: hypothetical protein DMG76_16525 [Acidobacteriota bacterium]
MTRKTICAPPSRWTFFWDEVITEPWAALRDWVLRANPGMPITPALLLAVSGDERWAEAAAEATVLPTAEVVDPGTRRGIGHNACEPTQRTRSG